MARRKRRKRTNSRVPAKGRLRDMADRLWATAVKADWANTCAICGIRSSLDAHHLIPRQHTAYRYDLRNGICLCARCHVWDVNRSPHQSAIGWLMWLDSHHHALSLWYHEAMYDLHKIPPITKNADFYCGVIRGLREYVDADYYRRIVGSRFADYLEEVNDE